MVRAIGFQPMVFSTARGDPSAAVSQYPTAMLPILLAIAAGVCWGVGEFFTKQALRTGQIGSFTAVAIRDTVALPLVWLAYWIAAVRMKAEPTNWAQADTSVLLKVILGSGVSAGALGLLCFYGALKVGEFSTVKPIAFTVAPAIAVLLGTLFLGDTFTLKKGVGVACVLIGVILVATK